MDLQTDTQNYMIHWWAAKTKFLAFFFLLLFSCLYSCKKDEGDFVGIDVLPGDENLQFAVLDSFDLLSYTSREDSLRSDERNFNVIGLLNDPYLGKTQSTAIAQLRLLESNIDFSAAKIDSVVLLLKYNGSSGYYGKVSSPQSFRVYELNQGVYRDSDYYTNSNISYGPTFIGELNDFVAKPSDSVKDRVGNKIINTAPHLRIPIQSAAFINKLKTAGGNFSNSEAFLNYIKGLAIVPVDKGIAPGEGALWYFDLGSGFSKLTVYYNDSLSKSFVMNSESARFNTVQHDYSSSPLAQQLGAKQKRDTCYAQSLGGVKTMIKFPNIYNLTENNKKIIAVVGAEMVIPILPGSAPTEFAVPQQMFLFEADTNGNNYRDANGLFRGYSGKYNSSKTELRVSIGTFVQALLNSYRFTGVKSNTGLLLAPSYSYAGMERAVFNTPRSGLVTPKLIITYTVVQ